MRGGARRAAFAAGALAFVGVLAWLAWPAREEPPRPRLTGRSSPPSPRAAAPRPTPPAPAPRAGSKSVARGEKAAPAGDGRHPRAEPEGAVVRPETAAEPGTVGVAPGRPTGAGTIRLEIRSSSGEPVEAEVTALLAAEQIARGFEADEVEPGLHVFRNLPPEAIRFDIVAPGFADRRVHARAPPSGEETVPVVLEPRAEIEGTVTDVTGAPIAGAYIIADPLEAPEGVERTQLRGRSEGDGSYRLSAARGGAYRVRAWTGDAVDVPREVVAPAARVDFRMVEGAWVEVRVDIEPPPPPAAARASLAAIVGLDDDALGSTETNWYDPAEEPGFDFGGLRPGRYRIEAQIEGYALAEMTTQVGAGGKHYLRLALGRGAAVEGTVRTAQGDPAAGVAVALAPLVRTAFAPLNAARTDAEGRYRLRARPGEPVRLRIEAPGGEAYDVEAGTAPAAGETLAFDWTLRE